MSGLKTVCIPIFAAALCVLCAAGWVSASQNVPDRQALYEEIAGKYQFDGTPGGTTILAFYVDDGILYGASEDSGETVELEPVEDNPLFFTATTSEGQYFEITFARDEDEHISLCTVMTMGQEFEGYKISDGSSQ